MTKKEAAIISAYTGILLGEFSDMHEYIEQILGRPVFTHQLANEDINNEIKNKIEEFYEKTDIQTPGVKPKDITKAIVET